MQEETKLKHLTPFFDAINRRQEKYIQILSYLLNYFAALSESQFSESSQESLERLNVASTSEIFADGEGGLRSKNDDFKELQYRLSYEIIDVNYHNGSETSSYQITLQADGLCELCLPVDEETVESSFSWDSLSAEDCSAKIIQSIKVCFPYRLADKVYDFENQQGVNALEQMVHQHS